jgi:hypothetical protein
VTAPVSRPVRGEGDARVNVAFGFTDTTATGKRTVESRERYRSPETSSLPGVGVVSAGRRFRRSTGAFRRRRAGRVGPVILLIPPAPPDDLPEHLKEGVTRRRLVAITGLCPCGAGFVQPRRADMGEVTHVPVEHEHGCEATRPDVTEYLRTLGWPRMSGDLVRADLGPGMVPTGFAEKVLEWALAQDEPSLLWDRATTCAALAQKWNGHGAEKAEIKSAQMFLEVKLGQLLGPSPRHGPGRGRKDPHGDVFIPPQIVSDLRRYHGMLAQLVGWIREGNRSRRSLLLKVDQAHAIPIEAVATPTVVTGDFREVLEVEPGSAALILTDPPYPAEYLPLWSDLGAHAAEWLMPGGSLVAYCGQTIMYDAKQRLDHHLRYWWTISLNHRHGSQPIPGKWVSCGWKPLLWFVRETRRGRFMLADPIEGSAPRKTLPTGDTDDWAQGVDELEPIISALTAPGDLIVDPFAGSVSVGVAALRFGRRFLGATL